MKAGTYASSRNFYKMHRLMVGGVYIASTPYLPCIFIVYFFINKNVYIKISVPNPVLSLSDFAISFRSLDSSSTVNLKAKGYHTRSTIYFCNGLPAVVQTISLLRQ